MILWYDKRRGRTEVQKSDIRYVRSLVEAGVGGAVTAWKGTGYRAFTPAVRGAVWAPAAVGAAIGVLSVFLNRNRRRSGSSVALGGLIGSALGFSAGAAFTGTAARAAVKNVNALRDAHWLEKNPIAYA
jgi:hypothetical protein